jgi:predicted dehydrogenase
MSKKVRMALVGCGNMGRHHLKNLLKQTDTTEITALCDISSQSFSETEKLFKENDAPFPPTVESYDNLLSSCELDAVFIVTPHNIHYEQAKMGLEAGVDVLLEKPMVMNAEEAKSLIKTRDATGKLLVVAFNGSLSPEIRQSVKLLRSGELGKVLSISGTIWQGWGPGTSGKWRQVPDISGGGFMFDTGAHLLNTVADLAGEDFVDVAAWADNYGRPVETLAAVIARLESGVLVSLHGCGETIRTCKSDIRVFCTDAILRTGAWGRWLEVQQQGESDFKPIVLPPSLGVWEQFLAVRNGKIKNPSPPEVGLRMAKLYDAIKASASRDGVPVKCV